MAHGVTRLEHPWPAVIMHWLHLLSFFVLIATGLVIHAHSDVFGPVGLDRQIHFIVMFVFVLTTITRIYWAFFGAGSANAGGLVRVRDYHHFGMGVQDWKLLPSWIAYYTFIRKTKPPIVKYGALQKITYMVLFPLGILVMALSGFAMWEPSMPYFTWFANAFGGQDGVRLMHYETMWILIVFFMIHLYLVIVEEPAQAAAMLAHTIPEDRRVPGDYPQSGGSAGPMEQEA